VCQPQAAAPCRPAPARLSQHALTGRHLAPPPPRSRSWIPQPRRLYLQALADASLARDRAAALSTQLIAARAAAESRAAQWEAAEGAKAALLRAAARRGEAAAARTVERAALQARRVDALQGQLEAACGELAAAQVSAAAGTAAAAAQRARADALEALLEASRSEADAARAEAAAAAMQMGGGPEGAEGGVDAVVKARDLEVLRYFDRRLAGLAGQGPDGERVKALTREVGAAGGWEEGGARVGRGGAEGGCCRQLQAVNRSPPPSHAFRSRCVPLSCRRAS
jgi:hypothetical protein